MSENWTSSNGNFTAFGTLDEIWIQPEYDDYRIKISVVEHTLTIKRTHKMYDAFVATILTAATNKWKIAVIHEQQAILQLRIKRSSYG